MSIALTQDQVALAESVAKFAARHAPTATTRLEFEDLALGIRPAWWGALHEQGLLTLHLPGRVGGDEAGLPELAVAVEEAGRGLLPGPLLPTLLASSVVARLGAGPAHDDLLARFAAGATGACATTADGLTARRDGSGWLVSGTTAPVLGGLSAQVAVLGAAAPDEPGGSVWFTLAEGQLEALIRDPCQGVDLTRDLGVLVLDELPVGDDQLLGGGEEAVRAIAAVLFGAEAVGLAPVVPGDRPGLRQGARAVRPDHRLFPGY